MPKSRYKSSLIAAVKLALAAALIGYLIHQAQSNESFAQLQDGMKDWRLLGGAFVCCLSAVLLTFVRWFFLVRALDLPFHLREALRLGFLGYLMNFVSLGAVGGDFFKALALAHTQPGRRTEAVATVVADRLIGLFALLLIASTAILLSGDAQSADPRLLVVCRATLITTAVAAGLVFLLIATSATGHTNVARLGRIRWVGPTLARLLSAAYVYRRNMPVLVLAMTMSIAVHVLLTCGVYLIGCGLPGEPPSLGAHMLIAPLSFVVGAIPITPSGLGTFEATLDYLYGLLAIGGAGVASSGTIVGFGYRLITIVIAVIGVGFYLASRREVAEIMHDAETEEVQRG